MLSKYLKMLREHIMERISNMKHGEKIDCEGLIAPEVWNPVPPPERRHAFGKPVAGLVAKGEVPLELVGWDSKRHNLYRKK